MCLDVIFRCAGMQMNSVHQVWPNPSLNQPTSLKQGKPSDETQLPFSCVCDYRPLDLSFYEWVPNLGQDCSARLMLRISKMEISFGRASCVYIGMPPGKPVLIKQRVLEFIKSNHDVDPLVPCLVPGCLGNVFGNS